MNEDLDSSQSPASKLMLKKILFGLLIFFALCGLAILLFAKDFEIEITEDTAQKAINEQIEAGSIKRLGVEITLKNAEVDFLANNTMKLTADMETNAFGYKHQVDGVFQSGLSYRSPRLYLNDITPVKINIESDDETKTELDELKSTARKFLQRQKDNLKSEKNKKTINKIIGVNNEEFQKTITTATYAFFENVPLYNLNNAGYKGSFASLALKDVKFSDGYATVTLSPVKALLRLLAIISLTLFLLVYFFGLSLTIALLNFIEKAIPKTD